MYYTVNTIHHIQVTPKRTPKYVQALEVTEYLNLSDVDNQNRLYSLLNEQGYFWESNTHIWRKTKEVTDLPSSVIRIRIWTDSAKVRGVAYEIRSVLEESGYELIEQSEPYTCRPPKQLDSRIYQSFRYKS